MLVCKIVMVAVLIRQASCIIDGDTPIGSLSTELIQEIYEILFGTLELLGACTPSESPIAEFFLYTRANTNNAITLDKNNPYQVDPNKKTFIFAHGWQSSRLSPELQAIKNELFIAYDANIIFVDYSSVTSELYTSSYCTLPKVAEVLGNFLCRLYSLLRIQLSNIHMIGHSLGGQLVGQAAPYTIKKCAQIVGNITALDPAGPLFEGGALDNRLDASDALFVQVIHTDNKKFGYKGECGTVDFHPNCGVQQPGCLKIDLSNFLSSTMYAVICSHSRSQYYYMESINAKNTPNLFIGQKWTCTNCLLCPFRTQHYALLGNKCSQNARGNFWLPTNDSPLYARGCSPYGSQCPY